MEIHAFVLHLVRASARRENAQALLADARDIGGFRAEIWPAVDGGSMSSTDLSSCVGAALFEPGYPFPLKAGEIGCTLSHRQIWAELQRRDAGAALILADDAEIDPDTFHAALSLALPHIERLGYIQFQTNAPKGPSHLVDTFRDCRLVVPQQAGLRATGQMVSRAAAARLLALSDPFDRPVDAFVQSHWHTGLRPAMIYPSGLVDIGPEIDDPAARPGDPSWTEKLVREFHGARYRTAVSRLSRRSAAPANGGFAADGDRAG
ncbi:Glycosyltransferase family 25 (LPS biosynthesis protein) [Roseovarius sp. THAF8]|uniref:glycosyltransferase family 25 protein n=1 Tax=Roseovarius sp. THAF8 TaxID=2587846 RepID=UPI001267F556|nr:glycosyltransferase family 25 protein [Roseovarius sp. THAF8]QFT98374.1 Glycosyltransferase family 25 (LPS biosynthesis protein) [Roseovarius sp. THAF8]